MAVLPQSPTAPEYLTVKELVSYGRFPYQKPLSSLTKEDHEIISWAMEKTGVYEWKDHKYPHYLVVNVNVHGLRWY